MEKHKLTATARFPGAEPKSATVTLLTKMGIHTLFTDKEGKSMESIPDVIQEMFNKEYGIKVGYNPEAQLLYYIEEVETGLLISQSAKEIIVLGLKATDLDEIKCSGTVHFGYNLTTLMGNTVYNGGGAEPTPRKRGVPGPLVSENIEHAYIDIDDFELEGKEGIKNMSYQNVPIRAFNIARIFEHEWIGHVLMQNHDVVPDKIETKRGELKVKPDEFETKPGGAASVVNDFRREMKLPIRIGYGSNVKGRKGVIFFGDFTMSKEEAKVKAIDSLKRFDEYHNDMIGQIDDIKMLYSTISEE